jgi:hypothetical protein
MKPQSTGLTSDTTNTPSQPASTQSTAQNPETLEEPKSPQQNMNQTRRAIASSVAVSKSDAKEIADGKALIDRIFAGDRVSELKQPRHTPLASSDLARKELVRYVNEKIGAGAGSIEDLALCKLVASYLLRLFTSGNNAEALQLAKAARAEIAQKYTPQKTSGIADLIDTLRVAQLLISLGSKDDSILGDRLLQSAKTALVAASGDEIQDFITLEKAGLRGPILETAALSEKLLPKWLGYKTTEIDGIEITVSRKPDTLCEEFAKKVQRRRGEFYYTTESGDRWRLGITEQTKDEPSFTFTKVENGAPASLTRREVRSLLNGNSLDALLDAESKRHDAENDPNTRRNLVKLDLTKGATDFITVIPETYNRVIAANTGYAFLLEKLLASRYGGATSPQLVISDDPMPRLRAAVARSIQQAPHLKDVFIQIHEHGLNDGICFKKKVTAEDLVKLSKEFPGVDLHVMSIACFGGGLRPKLQQEQERDPALKKRLHFYAHTRPENVATVLVSERSDIIFLDSMTSTPYMLFLIENLAKGESTTFGEAIDAADRESHMRLHKWFPNPETLFNGDLYGDNSQRASQEPTLLPG